MVLIEKVFAESSKKIIIVDKIDEATDYHSQTEYKSADISHPIK